MKTLTITLPEELFERIQALAEQTDRTVEECGRVAVAEFADNWEIHLRDVDLIDENEARTVLRAVNE